MKRKIASEIGNLCIVHRLWHLLDIDFSMLNGIGWLNGIAFFRSMSYPYRPCPMTMGGHPSTSNLNLNY